MRITPSGGEQKKLFDYTTLHIGSHEKSSKHYSKMFVVKVTHTGDQSMRRLVIEEPYSFAGICSVIVNRFELSDAEAKSVSLKYRDPEGDMINLNSDEELGEALSLLKDADPPVMHMSLSVGSDAPGASWAASLAAADGQVAAPTPPAAPREPSLAAADGDVAKAPAGAEARQSIASEDDVVLVTADEENAGEARKKAEEEREMAEAIAAVAAAELEEARKAEREAEEARLAAEAQEEKRRIQVEKEEEEARKAAAAALEEEERVAAEKKRAEEERMAADKAAAEAERRKAEEEDAARTARAEAEAEKRRLDEEEEAEKREAAKAKVAAEALDEVERGARRDIAVAQAKEQATFLATMLLGVGCDRATVQGIFSEAIVDGAVGAADVGVIVEEIVGGAIAAEQQKEELSGPGAQTVAENAEEDNKENKEEEEREPVVAEEGAPVAAGDENDEEREKFEDAMEEPEDVNDLAALLIAFYQQYNSQVMPTKHCPVLFPTPSSLHLPSSPASVQGLINICSTQGIDNVPRLVNDFAGDVAGLNLLLRNK